MTGQQISRRSVLAKAGLVTGAAIASRSMVAQAERYRGHLTMDDIDRWMQELSNWGKWGKDDQAGTINLITPAKRKAAASLVRDGVSVSASLNADLPKEGPTGVERLCEPCGWPTGPIAAPAAAGPAGMPGPAGPPGPGPAGMTGRGLVYEPLRAAAYPEPAAIPPAPPGAAPPAPGTIGITGAACCRCPAGRCPPAGCSTAGCSIAGCAAVGAQADGWPGEGWASGWPVEG